MKTFSLQIPEEQFEFAERLVRDGQFSDCNDVISGALGLMQLMDSDALHQLAGLRTVAREAFGALDRGEYNVYFQETLPEFFRELREKLLLQR